MDIFIPSSGRAKTSQPTLHRLIQAGLKPQLVVQAHEYDEYLETVRGDAVIHRLPREILTIAPTRQYILDRLSHQYFCMVDDDLDFFIRRNDDLTKLRDITDLELNLAFSLMEQHLNVVPHVGFAAREGANRNTDPIVNNTRIMRVLGYDAVILKMLGVRFDAMEVMEDFDVALTLLEQGYPNTVLNQFAHNQHGSNSSGGCSVWRTPTVQAANAVKLAARHPGLVHVVQKTTKTAWGGGTRTDVRVQWKKAFEQGRRK